MDLTVRTKVSLSEYFHTRVPQGGESHPVVSTRVLCPIIDYYTAETFWGDESCYGKGSTIASRELQK